MGQSWFDLHQTFVGSLIVFLGVIVGLVGNGLLQWWDRESKRSHDREVMRSALLAELAHLHASYEARIEMMEAATHGFDVPVHTPTEVYDRVLDRVGLFSPKQANAVIHAYLAAKHLPINLRRIARETAPLATPNISDDYIEVAQFNLPRRSSSTATASTFSRPPSLPCRPSCW